jgi:hypothetical protein
VNQALEIELGGDSKVEIKVEGVVVGDKRPRGGATRNRLHHGCFDLDEAMSFESAADR